MKAFYSLHDKYQRNYATMVVIITNYIPLEDKIVNGHNIKKVLKDKHMKDILKGINLWS